MPDVVYQYEPFDGTIIVEGLTQAPNFLTAAPEASPGESSSDTNKVTFSQGMMDSTTSFGGDASFSSALGVDSGETKKFTRGLLELLILIKEFIFNVEKLIINILENRDRYDVIEWIARKIGNTVSGNTSTGQEIVSAFKEVGGDIKSLFTKTELNALSIESPTFTPEGDVAYGLAKDYLLFPFMIWAVYNWYYKLFYPLSKCPVMKDYSQYYQMFYPGVFLGHLALPVFEINRGVYMVSTLFSPMFKSKWPLIFFTGSFLAVYYLWIQGVAQFDKSKMDTIIDMITYINIVYLMSLYISEKSPSTFFGYILALLVFVMLISFGKFLHNFIYILFMGMLIYFSFFVIFRETQTWNILDAMQQINKNNRFPMTQEDSFRSIKTWLKMVNNFIFTSPLLLLFCFVNLSHLTVVSKLNNNSPYKGFLSVALVLTFITAALYTVLEFTNEYITVSLTGLSLTFAGVQALTTNVPEGFAGAADIMQQINTMPKTAPYSNLTVMLTRFGPAIGIIIFLFLVCGLPIILTVQRMKS